MQLAPERIKRCAPCFADLTYLLLIIVRRVMGFYLDNSLKTRQNRTAKRLLQHSIMRRGKRTRKKKGREEQIKDDRRRKQHHGGMRVIS